jgi:hypothetical protein
MVYNCQRTLVYAGLLRRQFPELDVYVPAEHEDFVQRAFERGYVDEKEILTVDCDIVQACCGVLAYAPDGVLSNGMMVEINHAKAMGIPVRVVTCIDDKATVRDLLRSIE